MNTIDMQEQERFGALCDLDDGLSAACQMSLISEELRAYVLRIAEGQRAFLTFCRRRADELERWQREGGELALPEEPLR